MEFECLIDNSYICKLDGVAGTGLSQYQYRLTLDLLDWPPLVLLYSCFAPHAAGIVAIGAARSFELSPTELSPPLSLP